VAIQAWQSTGNEGNSDSRQVGDRCRRGQMGFLNATTMIIPRWLLVCFVLLVVADLASAQARVHVRAHTRHDGTSVRAHDRRASGVAAGATSVAPSSAHHRLAPASSASSSTSNFTPATDPALQENVEPAPIVEPEVTSATTRAPAKRHPPSRRTSRVSKVPRLYDWSRDGIPPCH
jgi:hypothetical protein